MEQGQIRHISFSIILSTPTPSLTPSPYPSPASFTYSVNSPSQTDTTITLNWNGVTATNLGILSYYNVTYGISANGTYTTIGPIYGYKNTSYVVTGLNPSTTYYFTIQYVFGHIVPPNGYQYQTATSNKLDAKTTPQANLYSDWSPYATIALVIAVALGASAFVYIKKCKK